MPWDRRCRRGRPPSNKHADSSTSTSSRHRAQGELAVIVHRLLAALERMATAVGDERTPDNEGVAGGEGCLDRVGEAERSVVGNPEPGRVAEPCHEESCQDEPEQGFAHFGSKRFIQKNVLFQPQPPFIEKILLLLDELQEDQYTIIMPFCQL